MGFSKNPDAPNVFMRVYSEGKEIRVDLTNRILSFQYEDNERKSDKATWTIDNFDFKMFDDPIWRPGNIVNITWGYPGNMSPTRSVCIHKTTGALTLTVEAIESGTAIMNELDRSQTYENVSYSDVVKIIAERNGFGPDFRFIEDTGEKKEVITQARMTDSQMIRRMAAKVGFQYFVDWDGLHFHRRDMGNIPIREYRYYSGDQSGREDILSINIESDVYRRLDAVRAKGYDPFRKALYEYFAANGTVDRKGNQPATDATAPTSELVKLNRKLVIDEGTVISGENGEFEILKAEDGEFIGRYLETGKVGPLADIGGGNVGKGDKHVHTIHVSGDIDNIRKEATKRYRRAVEHTIKMQITVIGDPLLVAKTNVIISNIGKRLSGKYYIKKVMHVISNSGGYTCDLNLITDGHNGYNRSGYAALDSPPVKSVAKKNDSGVVEGDPNNPRPDPDLNSESFVEETNRILAGNTKWTDKELATFFRKRHNIGEELTPEQLKIIDDVLGDSE